MTEQWIVWIIQGAFAAIMMGFSAAMAFILKVIWEGLRAAQLADIDQYRKFAEYQLHVSEYYVRQEVLKNELAPIRQKLDQIFDALWKAPTVDRRAGEREGG